MLCGTAQSVGGLGLFLRVGIDIGTPGFGGNVWRVEVSSVFPIGVHSFCLTPTTRRVSLGGTAAAASLFFPESLLGSVHKVHDFPLYMAACPLADPDLGIVPDMAHKVGTCICALCTCGNHICPGRSQSASKSSFSTSYRTHYTAVKDMTSRLHCPSTSPYRPSRWKLESTTSHQAAYRPYILPKRKPAETKSASPVLHHSSSMSSYKRDYPNWGPTGVPNRHIPSQPIRKSEGKLQGMSTYAQHFTRLKAGPKLRINPKRESVVRISSPFCASTTSQRDYTDPSQTRLNQPVVSRSYDYTQVETAQCHHVTTSQVDYRLKADQGIAKMTLLRRKLLRRLND